MTSDAMTERLPGTGPRPVGIISKIPPVLAISLFFATGVAWFLATQPIDVFKASFAAPDQPLDVDSWAALYSAFFGSVVALCGFVGIGIYVFSPKPARIARDGGAPADLARIDAAAAGGGRAEGNLARTQRVRARLAVVDARIRATPADDPEEMARVVESGMQEILTELRKEGRAEA